MAAAGVIVSWTYTATATYTVTGVAAGTTQTLTGTLQLLPGSGGSLSFSDRATLGLTPGTPTATAAITPNANGGWTCQVCATGDWGNSLTVTPGASVSWSGCPTPGCGPSSPICNTGTISASGQQGGGGVGGGSGVPPNGATTGDLTVQVVDASTGNNIQGATVVLQDATGTTTLATETTDASGLCYFSGLTTGVYNLNVTATGYAAGGASVNFTGGPQNQLIDLSPTGVTPPPPPAGCTPPSQSVYDLGTLATWLTQGIEYLACMIWSQLSPLWTGFCNSLWGALPSWVQQGWTSLITFVTRLNSKSASGLAQTGQTIASNIETQVRTSYVSNPTSLPGVISAAYGFGAQIGTEIITPTNPDSVTTLIQNLATQGTQAFISIFGLQEILDALPLWNHAGTAQLATSILEAGGVFAAMRGAIQPYFDMNISRNLTYHMNETYLNVLPDLGTLELLRNRGLYSDGDWQLQGQRVSGISYATMEQIRLAHHEAVNYQDLIVWNHRHTDQIVNPSTIADILNMDWSDFGQYFNERQYVDPSLRAVYTLAQLNILQAGDLTSILTRLGYRQDLLPGQSMSDFNLMMQYLTLRAEPQLYKAYLTSVLNLYLRGEATLDQLTAATQQVYSNASEQQIYLQTAQNKLAVTPLKVKHFTYTELIKFAEAGVNITQYVQEDLAAAGYSTGRIAVIQQYITATLAGKGVTESGQSASQASSGT